MCWSCGLLGWRDGILAHTSGSTRSSHPRTCRAAVKLTLSYPYPANRGSKGGARDLDRIKKGSYPST